MTSSEEPARPGAAAGPQDTRGASLQPLEYDEPALQLLLGPTWDETLMTGYRWMILGRTLDQRMLGLQRQGRVGFYGPATGQEAVSVGAALASGPPDWVFPGLREQLLALARGHALETYVHHLFADNVDPARGRQMPCHPTARDVHYVSMSSVVGTQITHAVGVAYGQKLRKDPGATLAFFGDGATSANDFHAGLNFAGVLALPVVFCLVNNQWAISVPVEHQTHVAVLADKARAYGIPGARVDGTDLVAVIAATRDALARARGGGGPTLLEFVVFRMAAHSSSDDPKRYQPKEFQEKARERDPVERLEGLLKRLGRLDDAGVATLAADADARVRMAIQTAEAAPQPVPDSLTTDVFSSVAPTPR
ncbi:MAG: thiamine pyrophosphate-dependent enzyme [Thermoplasmata archaeon]|nr:thiamine pyrophosphate-dependent enzyme [Thermoplasmata archaeon]